jgi:hypothetical protein
VFFDIADTLTKGAKGMTFTQPGCWFAEGGITWTDASRVVDLSLPVVMHDPGLIGIYHDMM